MSTTVSATTNLLTTSTFISLGAALLLGLFLSLVYIFSDKEKRYSRHFALALAILPVCVGAVIMLIGSDIARAISLGGVFALVRFRSVPGNSKDIVNVFLAMATGLACGMGYPEYAAAFALSIGAVYFLLVRFGYAAPRHEERVLKIMIPENLDYQGIFDDLFDEYTEAVSLDRVKTTNLGTLYELTYTVRLKTDINEKMFLDSLRCRNGNLNISLARKVADPATEF